MTADEGAPNSIAGYDAKAARLVAKYEALDPGRYRASYSVLLPSGPGRLAFDALAWRRLRFQQDQQLIE